MDRPPRIITLLTDFGSQDYFVAAMKGVVLSINPSANIIDITHEIPPQDVEAGAFTLLGCYRDFPAGTIHLAVVDPGVGSKRQAVVIECRDQYFVGPDNGLFSWICEQEENFTARNLTNETFFRKPVSATFHGRDIFAPVAASVSLGVAVGDLGETLPDIVRLDSFRANFIDENTIAGRIIHIDRFGNCVTNVTPADLRARGVASAWTLSLNNHEIRSFRRFFSEGATNDLFCLPGSAGFFELSVRNASAAETLNARRGQPVVFKAATLSAIEPQAS